MIKLFFSCTNGLQLHHKPGWGSTAAMDGSVTTQALTFAKNKLGLSETDYRVTRLDLAFRE